MGRSKWKGPYLNCKTDNNHIKQKNIFYRNSEIVPQLVKQTFQVYNGKTFVDISITSDMINHKFGEFVFTRGKFSFKKKK